MASLLSEPLDPVPGKTNSPSARSRIFWRTAVAASDSGTRCSLWALVRAAGMVHSASSKSTSAHLAPRTSPVRAAVRTVSSKALAARLSCLRSSAMNSPI